MAGFADNEYLFTSESVTEGHPDKVADQISDGVLDAVMAEDPYGRVACETLVNTGLVVVSGEISTSTYVDIQEVARETIRKIGYVDADLGFSADSCAVLNAIDKQSPDIAQGVDAALEARDGGSDDAALVAGAGDQGMMFGYASNETPELMPAPIMFAHRLGRELTRIRKAGKLCEDAMNAMVARAKPGVKEYELRAAAGAAILEGGGDIDFLIIGSTPMENPALVFGNPRPSGRVLKKGDIINMELAAGYRGYTAQVGSPICLGEPTEMVRKFWNEITLPGYKKIIAEIAPGKTCEQIRGASKFFRDKGVQSRPTQCHGIDLVTDKPHIVAEHVSAEAFEQVLKPGMIIMAEPNPITADGLFGIFLGHTFIVTDKGHEVVDKFPLEIAIAQC